MNEKFSINTSGEKKIKNKLQNIILSNKNTLKLFKPNERSHSVIETDKKSDLLDEEEEENKIKYDYESATKIQTDEPIQPIPKENQNEIPIIDNDLLKLEQALTTSKPSAFYL